MSAEVSVPLSTEVKAPEIQKGPDLKKKVKLDEEATLYSRRDFFVKTGWFLFGLIMGSWVLGLVRYMFPRVLFEPSNVFKAGFPSEYPVGEISTRWASQQRVWIARTSEGFYAILAKCTHLGCTPIWLATENKFKCPCHGSGFHRDGVNYEGPAPRALDRVKISLAQDGQILIDKGVLFQFEKGGWDKPEAFLKMAPK
ncbi:MAG: ubiquinol-cytochrome c reductase iron-sulfur subunit [Chlamydiae bacterium]|nr:ubiquinol-cytochrome c reductase iron-sulfur subunit [Chlamydiota bacterium]MBI3266757.1 ubiquinol-cytochrome c reductase iron-sulfur subunit [Chlamydiota bacterium]